MVQARPVVTDSWLEMRPDTARDKVAAVRVLRPIAALVFIAAAAWGQRQGPPLGVRVAPPPTPKAGALIDLTGYWVSIVADDERLRILTPRKGDFAGIPLNAEGLKLANAWDPAQEEPPGEPCKAYGAPASMGIPGRFRITWDNEATLKLETEAGTQTRLLHFNAPPETGPPSRQGYSAARWDATLQHGGRGGSLRVTTTNLRPGYLRKNGVPYSEKTTVTEYFDLSADRDGIVLVVNTVVEDPVYLTEPFRTSTNLRKQRVGSEWNPTACAAR